MIKERQMPLLDNEAKRRERLKVGVSVTSLGGYGDVGHAARVVENLERRIPDGCEVKIFADARLAAKWEVFNINSPTEYYSATGTYLHRGGGLFNVNGERVNPDVGLMIFPSTGYAMKELLRGVPVGLVLGEYGLSFARQIEGGGIVPVEMGLGFDVLATGIIQAGLLYSPAFGETVERVKKNRVEVICEVEDEISRALGRCVSLEGSRIGFYYAGDRETNYLYFQLLREAREKIDGKVVVFAPMEVYGEGNNKKVRELAWFVDSCGFSYLGWGSESNGDGKTLVVNSGQVPVELFNKMMAISDLPVLVTGDNSFTNGIDQVLTAAGNGFYYYCYFGTKMLDWVKGMHNMDPKFGRLAGGYYVHERVPDHIAGKISSDAIVRKLTGDVGIKELARLFYDENLAGDFGRAVQGMMQKIYQAKSECVEEPEGVTDAGRALVFIANAVKKQESWRIKGLMTK